MTELADPRLAAWESYYVIVGSSGAALIGLQFVVMTLVAGMRGRADMAAVGAFGAPTVVHLAGALIVSAIMSAPWPSLLPVSATLALGGLAGLVYSAIVLGRARRQSSYVPVWEDWLWFTILPGIAYASLALGALSLRAATATATYVIGAAALMLLLIGIHNSWDTVFHLVSGGGQARAPGEGRHAERAHDRESDRGVESRRRAGRGDTGGRDVRRR